MRYALGNLIPTPGNPNCLSAPGLQVDNGHRDLTSDFINLGNAADSNEPCLMVFDDLSKRDEAAEIMSTAGAEFLSLGSLGSMSETITEALINRRIESF